MKKVISYILILCLLLVAAGCKKNPASDTPAAAEPSTPVDSAPESVTAPYAAVCLPIVNDEIKSDDGVTIFSKSYQDMQLTLSGQVTADTIILDFMNKVDAAVLSSDAIAEAAMYSYPTSGNWIPYSFTMRYVPMRIDAGVLSLFGSTITYSGGSHPEYACISANYNLVSGDSLTLGSILTHVDKIDDLRDLVIEKLDAQAEEKVLQSGYRDVINDRFAGEESYDGDWYFSETGLCFYFAPYEIAPYSSGVIIAEIPYSELNGIIADEFFPAENSIQNGNAKIVPFSEEASQSYNETSPLILDNNGQMYFVEADSCITSIKIYQKNTDANTETEDAVYMAYYLNPGDAIMIQVLPENAANIFIRYVHDGKTVSIPLISE